MSLKFTYKKIDYDDGSFLVPKIPVVLESERQLIVMGLVDSGATHAFIPRKIADVLGLKYNSSKRINVTGIGSRLEGLETTMKITILGERGKKYEATVPVTVLDDPDVDEIILGRKGLFNLFKVSFHENEKYLVLKAYPDSQVPKFLKKGV